MASPATTALRAELDAALEIVIPQVRGLKDLMKVSLSEETLGFVQQELDDHTRRRDLIQNTLLALDALETDDYPDMPIRDVPPAVAAELKEQADDFAAAFAEFEAFEPASNISIGLGTPADKP